MPGKYYDDLHVGMTFFHEEKFHINDDHHIQFCKITKNTQPLHLDPDYAKKTPFKQILVNGLYTFSTVVGMTVPDITEGTIIANLNYSNISHPNPVYLKDTITCQTKVLKKEISKSKPNRYGKVSLQTIAKNQKGQIVLEFERLALFYRNKNSKGVSNES